MVTPCVPTETLILVTDAPPPAGSAGIAQWASPYEEVPRGHCLEPPLQDLAANKADGLDDNGDPREILG